MNRDSVEIQMDDVWSLRVGEQPLSTFQRVLLMTDGTVTEILEAHLAEAICVVKLSQSFGRDLVEAGLELLDSERVLHRSVLLQGATSGINYIYADSAIVADRLPPVVLDGLLTGGEPIGRLMADNRVETFREIMELGVESAAGCAEYFGVDGTSDLIFRTYQIHLNQRPVIRITEKFPATHFAS
jgi:chorismate-pyruvate lyase